MNPLPTLNEYLNVELDWDVHAGTSDCENDLDYLADSTLFNIMEPINSNAMGFCPYPMEYSSDSPIILSKEIVAPPFHYCQSPSDVHYVKTVRDTSSTDQFYYSTSENSHETDQFYFSTSEPSLESLLQALHKDTVAALSHSRSPSDVHSVKTVGDTSCTEQSYNWTSEIMLGTDQCDYSTNENSLESLDQATHKEKCPRPVKRTKKPTVTTRRSGWKKPKDAPKRYLSAYNIFFSEERRRVYAESDERAGFSELGKIIGQRWRSLTDDQREPYEIMAEKDIGRYRREMRIYEDVRRRKYGRSLYRSPSPVTMALTLSDGTRCPSSDRGLPALHPVLESVMRQHRHHPPTVYAPQVIMPDQHHSGQYAGKQQQQQHAQVQYAGVRMTRKKAQEYMRRYAGK